MDTIHEFKIALARIVPQIWRRVQVPSDFTLHELHYVIQNVMQWDNSHLHMFTIDEVDYGSVDTEWLDNDYEDEAKAGPLSKLITKPKSKITYTYDFGDDWVHVITLEKILPRDENVLYPVCIGGKRAAPPEDCGGIWGYQNFAEIMQNPNHPEYEDYEEWYGGTYDPEEFDIDAVNKRLQRVSRTSTM